MPIPYGVRLAGEARRLGQGKPGIVDGLLAAIALRTGATIATRNLGDFKAMGVPCQNPLDSRLQPLIRAIGRRCSPVWWSLLFYADRQRQIVAWLVVSGFTPAGLAWRLLPRVRSARGGSRRQRQRPYNGLEAATACLRFDHGEKHCSGAVHMRR